MKIILVGDSCTGKNTVARILTKESNLKFGMSTTTRPKRNSEKDEYHFLSDADFIKLKNAGLFVNVDTYNGNYYGYEKQTVLENDIFITAGQGLSDLITYIRETLMEDYIVVGLTLPFGDREARLYSRNLKKAEIERRLSKENQERFKESLKEHADVVFENTDSSKTALKILCARADKRHDLKYEKFMNIANKIVADMGNVKDFNIDEISWHYGELDKVYDLDLLLYELYELA